MDAASDANDFDLSRDGFGRLRLVVGGVPHGGVVPVRSFPLAAPAEGVSLVASDGRELAWIERLDRLDVQRVGRLDRRGGHTEWYGPTEAPASEVGPEPRVARVSSAEGGCSSA